MKIQLSKKERMLLEDEKTQEELCIAKYNSYAQQAQDPQLKQLFTKLANEERKHYDTVNQLLQGFMPSSGQGQGGSQMAKQAMQSGQTSQQAMEVGQMGGQMGQKGMQSGQSGQSAQPGQSGSQTGQQLMQSKVQLNANAGQGSQSQSNSSSGNSADKILCIDMLSTEKYVSSSYDTAIFESASTPVRQALQHIQKDEQSHGEQIFQYMSSNGMYQVQ
ncbi:spore coat protein [Sinanaerobacter chloroacetimidivorans]|jgi:spore coat protein CotF|uniref:Spore coat protein n=1 Tax=Sinanaerobacter chloroacetimidivorans TaxID=2818044 RepID=A0A8J7W0D2_9FIRM|nr:spore coat protein [Sinanaerobacter chloroacetimidivorans]MBR0598041.1 spore coat protein [Sinanaerobacter chloroacetimidivorans]